MTKLLYLDDSYCYEATSEIEAVSRDERGDYIVTSQTVFYPQGGGQQADKGRITIQGINLPVTFVGFMDGQIRHYVPETAGIMPGQVAQLHVDGGYRQSNSRLHTGGHLISHVMETLDERLIPIKGYHFPDGSYVEFINDRGVDGISLIEVANDRLRQNVDVPLNITSEYSDFDAISLLRPELAPHIPREKPSRIVTIGTYRSLPCGGTHVSSTSELGAITITKIKNQKGNLRVSYQLA